MTQIKAGEENVKVPEFNCAIVNRVHTTLDIATVGEQVLQSTRFITVPYITNIKEVVHRILHHVPQAKPKKAAKICWRDVQKDLDAEASKTQKTAKT